MSRSMGSETEEGLESAARRDARIRDGWATAAATRACVAAFIEHAGPRRHGLLEEAFALELNDLGFVRLFVDVD